MKDLPERSFLRPMKVILLVLLAVVIYLVALVVWMPAGWVWSQVSASVGLPPGVQVQRVSGTLWQGAARLDVQRHPMRVAWDLSWPDIAGLRQPVAFTAETGESRVRGGLLLGWPSSLVVDATGRIHVAEFEELIRQSGGALLEGDVIIERLRIAASDGRLESATGLGRWPGGQVSWPMGGSVQTTVFPPMQATLADTTQGVLLAIAEEGKAEPAADATIGFDGMMGIRVYKRMVDLAGQQWSASAAPGDVIFQVQQPLVPGGRL
ncbi:type II secretion system protein N [Marinobacter sp. OP 3.4]|uniref:type II secretion system protein N n=1 Tax=Marinobacter sp. OP 3.4 TaxID=3076501 RepID=UPI002E22665A